MIVILYQRKRHRTYRFLRFYSQSCILRNLTSTGMNHKHDPIYYVEVPTGARLGSLNTWNGIHSFPWNDYRVIPFYWTNRTTRDSQQRSGNTLPPPPSSLESSPTAPPSLCPIRRPKLLPFPLWTVPHVVEDAHPFPSFCQEVSEPSLGRTTVKRKSEHSD